MTEVMVLVRFLFRPIGRCSRYHLSGVHALASSVRATIDRPGEAASAQSLSKPTGSHAALSCESEKRADTAGVAMLRQAMPPPDRRASMIMGRGRRMITTMRNSKMISTLSAGALAGGLAVLASPAAVSAAAPHADATTSPIEERLDWETAAGSLIGEVRDLLTGDGPVSVIADLPSTP